MALVGYGEAAESLRRESARGCRTQFFTSEGCHSTLVDIHLKEGALVDACDKVSWDGSIDYICIYLVGQVRCVSRRRAMRVVRQRSVSIRAEYGYNSSRCESRVTSRRIDDCSPCGPASLSAHITEQLLATLSSSPRNLRQHHTMVVTIAANGEEADPKVGRIKITLSER